MLTLPLGMSLILICAFRGLLVSASGGINFKHRKQAARRGADRRLPSPQEPAMLNVHLAFSLARVFFCGVFAS